MPQPPELTWSQFLQVAMYVGTVRSAEPFPEAHNPSYKLRIDFGPLGERKSSAQLTDLYRTDDLVGRQVVAVLNFPPKQIANMMSECLVLGAVGADKVVTLLHPGREVADGTRIG